MSIGRRILAALRAPACGLLLLAAPALAQPLTTAVVDPVPAFDGMPLRSGRQFIVTVRNTGSAPLRVTGVDAPPLVYWTGMNDCIARDVAPQTSCTIEFRFFAGAVGSGSAFIRINGNVPSGQVVVPIAWRIDPFPIELSTPALTFEQQLGMPGAAQVARIRNAGVASYDVAFLLNPTTDCGWLGVPTLPCVARVEKEKASFEIASTCRSLAPGESCDVAVRFRPPDTLRDVVRVNLEVSMGGTWGRVKLAGASLPRQTVPGTVVAIEYVRYYADTIHYFLTVSDEEKGYLDTGRLFGWQRTGEAFWVHPADALVPGMTPVCRYYGRPEAGLDSHFYSASPAECAEVARKFGTAWIVESEAFFRVSLPDLATGACPANTSPVYRWFNNLPDVNHVYTTSPDTIAHLRLAGWIAEGYGPDAVAMCVPQ